MRKHAVRCAVLLVVLAVPAAAQAHVSLHPNTLPAGSFPTIDLRVPSEEPNANTTKVAVQFPPGFLDVLTGYMPGWTARKITEKLATPVKTDTGTITEQVREVVWSGGKIPPESFLDFPISTTIPDTATGNTLAFKTLQTYSNGKVVRWIGPADADQPAPTVMVTPKGGVLQDVAGTEAGPGTAKAAQTGASSSAKSSSKKASKGLGVAALAIAIVALLAGIGALVIALGRRSRAGGGV